MLYNILFRTSRTVVCDYNAAFSDFTGRKVSVGNIRRGIHEVQKQSFSIFRKKTFALKRGIGMETEFINITEENADTEHLCCIIRTRTAHPGVETKRRWLKDRLKEGHVFRKLNINGTVFIEYAPLETAWVPITGDNFYYIYCLWVTGAPKGHGYGKQLMEYCINDAKMHNKSGICMLGSKKQKLWLSDKKFAQSYGFESVDETGDGYELLALRFDGAMPRFAPNAKK